ncbi:PUA-like domain-containing protein [Spinellus fusiger]|nr:PUA-like domain-containing protein [Spinellus fusiger]
MAAQTMSIQSMKNNPTVNSPWQLMVSRYSTTEPQPPMPQLQANGPMDRPQAKDVPLHLYPPETSMPQYALNVLQYQSNQPRLQHNSNVSMTHTKPPHGQVHGENTGSLGSTVSSLQLDEEIAASISSTSVSRNPTHTALGFPCESTPTTKTKNETGSYQLFYPCASDGFIKHTTGFDLTSPSGRYSRRIPVASWPDPMTKRSLNIVPIEYQGPLPHVPVGYSTEMRMIMSSIGIHRPPVAGISGSQALGFVLSIVMSGEYPEDTDNGDEFVYTGSGGRDRQNPTQTFDQDLTRSNLLLAKSCKAPWNPVHGSDAMDQWQKGTPIRVVRGSNLSKNSKLHQTPLYGPTKGYRYDGIYKVVRYWPANGYTGHKVWSFLLRRDDPSPAPWTEKDKYKPHLLGDENWGDIHGLYTNDRDRESLFSHAKPRGQRTESTVLDILPFYPFLSPAPSRLLSAYRTAYLQAISARLGSGGCQRAYQKVMSFYSYLSPPLACLLCHGGGSNEQKNMDAIA